MRRLAALLALAAIAGPAAAHHSFSSEHDPRAPLLITGKVTRVDWINPHAFIHLSVTGAGGEPQIWLVQMGAVRNVRANGLNERTLAIGTEVTVRGYRSRDKSCAPACQMGGEDVTFADGSRLGLTHSTRKTQEAGKAYNARIR